MRLFRNKITGFLAEVDLNEKYKNFVMIRTRSGTVLQLSVGIIEKYWEEVFDEEFITKWGKRKSVAVPE